MTTEKAGPQGPATQHDAARRRADADVLQRRMVRLWIETRNGQYAILAWQAARAGEIPVSESVLGYIDEAFANVMQANTPKEIAVSFRLAGDVKNHEGPKRFLERDEKIAIAAAVKFIRPFVNDNATAAIEAVAAERGLPVRRVKAAYYEFRDIAPGF